MSDADTKKPSNQAGFASIVIALILIVVLALLTVGFAQLARREQRTALDKQLAIQAYYAAESGVNDAYHDITQINPASGSPYIYDNTASGGGTDTSATTCMTPTTATSGTKSLPTTAATGNPSVSAATGVSYACLLVNLKPPNLVYSGVSPGASKTSTFSTTGSLNQLTVYWGSSDNHTTYRPTGSTSFTPLNSWNSAGVLQFSITPLAGYDRNSLMQNTFTAYLYPSSNGAAPRRICFQFGGRTICFGGGGGPAGPGSTNYVSNTPANGSNEAPIVSGHCSGSGTYPCSVTIKNIISAPQYLIHIVDYYDPSNITVSNARDGSGTQLNFVNGQAQIDVTGKAKNVLKRIQVRLPLTQPNTMPPYAIEGQNVCKRFDTYPGSVSPQPDPGDAGCSLN